MPNFSDPKCSKELNDEDLKQVSGGSGDGYSQNKCRPDGFLFYDMYPQCNYYCEIVSKKEFVSTQKGWKYICNLYSYGVCIGNGSLSYTDWDIDDFISHYGLPQQ